MLTVNALICRFPCHWDGASMVVLNEFTIDPPYDTVLPSKAASDTSGIERVIKVVSHFNQCQVQHNRDVKMLFSFSNVVIA